MTLRSDGWITIESIFLRGPDAADFRFEPCRDTSLDPLGSCEVEITFTPHATVRCSRVLVVVTGDVVHSVDLRGTAPATQPSGEPIAATLNGRLRAPALRDVGQHRSARTWADGHSDRRQAGAIRHCLQHRIGRLFEPVARPGRSLSDPGRLQPSGLGPRAGHRSDRARRRRRPDRHPAHRPWRRRDTDAVADAVADVIADAITGADADPDPAAETDAETDAGTHADADVPPTPTPTPTPTPSPEPSAPPS